MGSLYRSAGAASTAVEVAWERFRRHALNLCGLKGQLLNSVELAAAIRRRFPSADATLEEDLRACEEAAANDKLQPGEALRLVQKLGAHESKLDAAARPSRSALGPAVHTEIHFKTQERAS